MSPWSRKKPTLFPSFAAPWRSLPTAFGPSLHRFRNSLATAARVESCGIVAASNTSCGCFSNERSSANCDSNLERKSADHNRSATGKAGSASVLPAFRPPDSRTCPAVPPAGLNRPPPL